MADATSFDLRQFTTAGYDKGRNVIWQGLWFVALNVFFQKWWFPPSLRPPLLRAFGAEVGSRVFVRHRVRVLWPWKLTIADDVWIGEDAWLLNLEPITIEANVCVSQGVLLCTGSHKRNSSTFAYDNGPITVRTGSWIAARATVLRRSTIGPHALVPAGAMVDGDVQPGTIYGQADAGAD